jgi:sulfur relay protein, TusE/DsrC/DsvC family
MELKLTNEGFLVNLNDWTPQVAQILAQQQNIVLTAEHWEIINLLRDFYFKYNAAPAMRTLVNAVREQYGAEKGNSIYLHTLFPAGAALQANKLAGLPKPVRCI